MAVRRGDGDGRRVYRPVFARVLVVIIAAFGLWWDVDLLLSGPPGAFVPATLWLVAACAGLWALFWRPAVIVDDEGAELRNVLRDVRVPWAALEGVETRYALTLLAGGCRHTSWAAPAGGRPLRRPSEVGARPGTIGPLAGPGPASRHLGSPSGVTAFLVEQRWQAWQQAARARAFLASRAEPAIPGPDAGLDEARPDDAGPVEAGPVEARPEEAGPDEAGPDDVAAPGVVVRWRPLLPGTAVVAALLAALLTPVLG